MRLSLFAAVAVATIAITADAAKLHNSAAMQTPADEDFVQRIEQLELS